MMESINPGFLRRNIYLLVKQPSWYINSSLYLSISVHVDQHKIIWVRLSNKCSQVLYIKVLERNQNLVYSSARLSYGSQRQN